jgi:Alg9-like mannosyltransferase family
MVALFAGGLFRLLAVFFSKGFGMHDDHFLVIEAAQSWVDGYDYNTWFPSSGATEPTAHNFVYPGLHYLLFKFLDFCSITDADVKMYIVRFIHAAFSMSVIILGYKIVEQYTTKKQAGYVALLLALFFFMPLLSVRNMVEVVCVPFLMYGTYVLVKAEKYPSFKKYLFAGILIGLAFSFRFQCFIFAGGLGLYFIIKQQWKPMFIFGLGFLACATFTQSIVDCYLWGYPFAEFIGYFKYNMANATQYLTQPWYTYIPLVAGILIPPVSIFLCLGYLRTWKKYLLLFLPSFIFLVAHSYFPNKQERFIFPSIPFIIMAGFMGWYEFKERSQFWKKRIGLYKACWIFFWTLNTIALCFLSITYIKKDRVEAMRYLSHKTDVKGLIMEDRNDSEFILPTLYYMEKWPLVCGLTDTYNYDSLKRELYSMPLDQYPNYIIFVKDDGLDARLATFKNEFADLKFETTIEGGMLDALMHWLNPVNKFQRYHIYKVDYSGGLRGKLFEP